MPRRPHIIRENKVSEYPQQCIWFDTETKIKLVDGTIITVDEYKALLADLGDKRDNLPKVTHILNFGWACYMRKHHNGIWGDETWLQFDTLDEFWAFVCDRSREKTKLYLFCHNTSFDLPVLNVFHKLPQYGFTLRSAIIDAPPTVLRFSSGSKSIVIIDTLNIWRMPLSFLGDKIGLPKLDMPDNNDLALDWQTYGKRDVEIIRTACIKWWEFLASKDLGSFGSTLASQSMRVFRHKYMKHTIFIDNNENALNLTRSGYYGGRVECFRIGKYKQRYYALDVNSMYPSVMYRQKYPNKLISHTRYATEQDLRIWLRTYSVCARVLLITDRPFAPYRGKSKLYFPIGEFECILSTPELQYALDNCTILKILEVAVYDHEPLFTTMIEDMSALKVEYKLALNYVDEWLIKILMNSFYGKWGQSGGKWLEELLTDDLSCKRWIEYDVDSGKTIHHRQLGGLVQVKDTETESIDSFPAIAGHVTAYARMDLWRIIEKAGVTNVLYCDTDCVLTNEEGRDRLSDELHDTRLGALKIAGDYDGVEILGCKDYQWGPKIKHKGVKKNAVWLDSHTVRQEQWSGLRGLILHGDMSAPQTKTMIKNLRRIYDKGVVAPDGTVSPHHLPAQLHALK